MQSLFSVTAFKRYIKLQFITKCTNLLIKFIYVFSLLLEVLKRLSDEKSRVNERLHAWKEVLALAAEFEVHSSPTAAPAPTTTPEAILRVAEGTAEVSQVSPPSAEVVETRQTRSQASNTPSTAVTPESASTPTTDSSKPTVTAGPSKSKVISPSSRSALNSPVTATNIMSALFQTFQRQMDSISGINRDYTTVGAKNASKKNGQQDAVEFLTFLLDALHEEIVHVEAEDALRPELAGHAESVDDLARLDSLEMEIALTRQNSLSADAGDAGANPDEGWSTVSKNTRTAAKAKNVVVDKGSQERAAAASKASVISQLFHTTLR